MYHHVNSEAIESLTVFFVRKRIPNNKNTSQKTCGQVQAFTSFKFEIDILKDCFNERTYCFLNDQTPQIVLEVTNVFQTRVNCHKCYKYHASEGKDSGVCLEIMNQ